MLIRPFEPSDKEAFLELCKNFYDSEATLRPYDADITLKTFNRIMDKHENLWGYMLTDKDLDQIVGYALLTSYWSNEDGGNVIVLDELYISPVNRHKGYARLFIQWIEENFTDASAVTLEVLTSNQRACDLYNKAGYRPDGFTTYTKSLHRK